jgi:DnaA family protein
MIDYPPDQVLDDMEYQDLVCLAGVEAVAGRPGWEEALFGFYNRIQDQGNRLVIGADGPPRELPLALPDLKSRLSAALVFHLATYDDEDKIAILRHRAARLGIELSREVGLFIVNRGSRDLDHLMAYLERLDLASLAEKRRVTIPFVKQVFGW